MNKSPKFYLKFSKKIFIVFILIASLLLLLILVPKKTSFNLRQLSYEEKKGLNNFLEYLLLRENGIYVLFGSKPIVCSNLCIISENKMKSNTQKIPEDIKKNANRQKIKLKFYMKDWERVQGYFQIKEKYLLVFKKHEKDGIASVYLVNIPNLISVLTEYHSIFKERIKIDFNPLTIVNEFNDDNSKFWNLVHKDLLLKGLIFGYGLTNSSLFERWFNVDEIEYQNLTNLGFKATDKHLIDKNIKITYQNFPLPVFKSFPNDPIFEKYKNERKKIQALYRGRNALEVTLRELCE